MESVYFALVTQLSHSIYILITEIKLFKHSIQEFSYKDKKVNENKSSPTSIPLYLLTALHFVNCVSVSLCHSDVRAYTHTHTTHTPNNNNGLDGENAIDKETKQHH